MRPTGLVVLEDEPLLRNVICGALEASIPGLRTHPASTRLEASVLLDRFDIGQMVSEVTVGGTNISRWLIWLLVERPSLNLVTFSTQKPWVPAEFLESPRLLHIEKRGGRGVEPLVTACRMLFS